MAAPMDPRRTLTEKHLQKKLRKIEKVLASKEHLEISKQPTRMLCVQNGGLENNVSQAELLPLFADFGEVENVVMIPKKQFCFVSFTNDQAAPQALQRLNGHLLKKGKDPTQDVVLYLFYVEKAPPSMIASSERPPGLQIVEDFVSEDVEEELLNFINTQMDFDSKDANVMKHRQVKHFGFEFRYDINDVDIKNPLPEGIPPLCCDLLHRAQSMDLISHIPDQLTVNKYKPGQGIPPHVDTVDAFEDGILSLSLGSQTVMDFRHPDGRHLIVPVPRRSLLIMTGESRYIWSHGITPRKSDIVATPNGDGLTLLNRGVRTSFTFRKVVMDRELRKKDVNVGLGIVPLNDADAKALEEQHVHKVYDDIAEHFSGTRYKPWPKVADFMLKLPPFSLVADIGCGNGKCLGINKSLFEIGCDYSINLASICHSRGFQTCVADVTCLPFRSRTFDVVLCIAVVHHMSTKERRAKAILEVVRILRVGGKALIYVWAMEQNLDKTPSKYINKSQQKKKPENPEAGSCISQDSHKDVQEIQDSHKEVQETQDSHKDVQEIQDLHKDVQEIQDSYKDVQETQDSYKNVQETRKDVQGTLEDKISSHCKEKLLHKEMKDGCYQEKNLGQMSCDIAQPIKVRRKFPKAAAKNVLDVKDVDKENTSSDLHVKKLPIHKNRTEFQEQDMLVPWLLKGKETKQFTSEDVKRNNEKGSIFHRFYHVFRQGELEAVCKKVAGCVVQSSYYDQGNWCVVLEKV